MKRRKADALARLRWPASAVLQPRRATANRGSAYSRSSSSGLMSLLHPCPLAYIFGGARV
jgi:hypothetical protein